MKPKNLSIVIIAVMVSMLLNGCATSKIAKVSGWQASIYQSASSTKIGCLPEEIAITDLDQHGGISRARDWFATCRGIT